jgi:hypothetical protein
MELRYGGYLFLGIGKQHFFTVNFNDPEKDQLKKRLANCGDTASDHDLACFLRLYRRSNIEVTLALSFLVGVVAPLMNLLGLFK